MRSTIDTRSGRLASLSKRRYLRRARTRQRELMHHVPDVGPGTIRTCVVDVSRGERPTATLGRADGVIGGVETGTFLRGAHILSRDGNNQECR